MFCVGCLRVLKTDPEATFQTEVLSLVHLLNLWLGPLNLA